MGLAVI